MMFFSITIKISEVDDMRKLNNMGWGLSNLIGFLVVFFLFAVVICFLVYQMSHEESSDIHLVKEEYITFHKSLDFKIG